MTVRGRFLHNILAKTSGRIITVSDTEFQELSGKEFMIKEYVRLYGVAFGRHNGGVGPFGMIVNWLENEPFY